MAEKAEAGMAKMSKVYEKTGRKLYIGTGDRKNDWVGNKIGSAELLSISWFIKHGAEGMSTHQIHVFISHSWTYESHYNTLSSWVFDENWNSGQASLDFRNFSVPKNDPIHNAANDKQLREAIYNQIARSHVIVIPTGVYASYSRWIQEEIGGAANYRKPILAVNPWAQERKSDVVQNAAAKLVGWNKQSVVDGIWQLYRA